MKINTYFRFALLVAFFQFVCLVPTQAQYILSRHDSVVREFANQLAKTYCRQINPQTGKDAYAVVKSWTYDEYRGKYFIDVELHWSGRPSIFDDRTNNEVDGQLTVSANGSNPDFTEKWANSSVKTTRDNARMWGAVQLGVALYAASNSQ